jgi:hypothetical protein
VAIASSLDPRAPKAVTGLANHPANKQEWQWLAMQRSSPLFTDGLNSKSGERLPFT